MPKEREFEERFVSQRLNTLGIGVILLVGGIFLLVSLS